MAINRGRNGSTFKRAQGECVRCGKAGELRARGLDASCYEAERQHGSLIDFSRKRRRLADTIAEYRYLAAAGEIQEQIAKRLGLTAEGLRTALYRSRKQALLATETNPSGGVS